MKNLLIKGDNIQVLCYLSEKRKLKGKTVRLTYPVISGNVEICPVFPAIFKRHQNLNFIAQLQRSAGFFLPFFFISYDRFNHFPKCRFSDACQPFEIPIASVFYFFISAHSVFLPDFFSDVDIYF